MWGDVTTFYHKTASFHHCKVVEVAVLPPTGAYVMGVLFNSDINSICDHKLLTSLSSSCFERTCPDQTSTSAHRSLKHHLSAAMTLHYAASGSHQRKFSIVTSIVSTSCCWVAWPDQTSTSVLSRGAQDTAAPGESGDRNLIYSTQLPS
jgi:hypothetical protein